MTLQPTGMELEQGIWLCPIWGVEGSEELDYTLMEIVDEHAPTATFKLKAIGAAEKERLSRGLENLPMTSTELDTLSLAIEVESSVMFGPEPIRTSGLSAIGFALAFGFPRVSIPHCFLLDWSQGRGGLTWSGHELFLSGLPPVSSRLEEKDLPQIRRLVRQIWLEYPKIEMALSRFYSAGNRASFLDQLLDYVIAAECVVKANNAALFGRRAAAVAQTLVNRTVFPEALCRWLYEVRSQLVHGNEKGLARLLKVHGDESPAAITKRSKALAGTVIQAALREPKLFNKKYVDKLAEDLQGSETE